MRYLSDHDFNNIEIDWGKLVDTIYDTCFILKSGVYAQPLKTYLRYKNPSNRIIAMPAFLGGEANISGIKWIASFPDNLSKNIKRAHSTTILNQADTGLPLAIINTAIISGLRTAAVSGAIVKEWMSRKSDMKRSLRIGISGFGPIGQFHMQMLNSLYGEQISEFLLYDLKLIDVGLFPKDIKSRVLICDTWQDAYRDSDLFCACTTTPNRYIDLAPPDGSLQLNVSLRDYKASIRSYIDLIVVDDWNEVCRENTDIEQMYNTEGLKEEDTVSIVDFLCENNTPIIGKEVVMFNPMGMAVFDIAVAKHFYDRSIAEKFGIEL
ncbi:2,3-diaminopropionate biosynthesis protein SbnB [Pedobacter kyonggii]|uniref:2,3-diaminopropionate biosynthesis protein SbnB n=1 Tax=Pedobacter kyonggii TaxID=1926871 RepID=A0A4Q9HH57_9SPHI|nr:2,3-diaminopropionate biosynthesis protein SbnB [Pedobacter kyonggii]TBO44289.1 2,3-diaminopropionate biosynthesis protein SbnB [Pedobacter kyonggii]